MESIFKKGQTNPIFKGFLKKLGCRRTNCKPKLVPLFLLVDVPRIHVLADHNAVDANIPHLRGTVTACFQLVVDLFPLVGTFHCSTAFIRQFPSLRIARCLRKQTRIILALRVEGTSILGCGARCITRTLGASRHLGTEPFETLLRLVVAVAFHLQTRRADGDSFGRDANVAPRLQRLGAAYIEINERLDVLMREQIIDRAGIVGGVEEHLVDHAQSESLRKLYRTDDKAHCIVARSGLEPGIQRQIVVAVCGSQHVQVVSVEVLFSRTVPARIAIRLGI